ncbi:MAG: hypothetical protein JNK97_11000 [Zoogloea sp.]|nr:hypothetical protein [Zoogloea sp.]
MIIEVGSKLLAWVFVLQTSIDQGFPKNDLLTYLELGLLPAADACKRASISLFSTRAQAQHRLDVSPHLGKFVASVSLTKAHGRVGKPSSSGHIDWWPYAGMRNPADLEVV